jgi:2-aminoethylphosphonate-pyruvate transaminase
MRRLNLDFVIQKGEMCSILTAVRMRLTLSVRDLRERLREKSNSIFEGKGCFAGKVFQVGNIGELSDYDIRFFLATLKDVFVTLQAEVTDIMAPARAKHANLILRPNPDQLLAKAAS